MEELFRFLLARPAQQAAKETPSAPVEPTAGYDKQLRAARSSKTPRAALKRAASAHSESAEALKSMDELKYAEPLAALSIELVKHDRLTLHEFGVYVRDTLGREAPEVVSDERFRKEKQTAADAIVTDVILGADVNVRLDDAAGFVRMAVVVERVASEDAALELEGAPAAAATATLVLPAEIFPIPPDRDDHPHTQDGVSGDGKSRLAARRDALIVTYQALTRVSPEHLMIPESVETVDLRAQHEADPLPPPQIRELAGHRVGADASVTGAADLSSPTRMSLLLSPAAAGALAEPARAVLAERHLDLTKTSVPDAVERLGTEIGLIEAELTPRDYVPASEMMQINQTFVPISAGAVGQLVFGGLAAESVPSTHGNVTPAGIGDLLVVRQFLKRYEAKELAHIENVLQGEYKERVHKRSLTTEETVTVQVETKREEERDQQTTERFELKNESSNVQKEDSSLKIGLAVSGKYGPVVEFKATTDFALNQSKEEATKIATSYSKDVTTRATSKIYERRYEERILKTTEVVEETNTHGLDNKAGATNVVGQYQWVDKVYEAQVFNYGKRLLFDLMVPEPAAFLLYATGSAPKAGADLVKPTPFSLRPSDITEWNYGFYVQQYAVVGVEPPPAPYTTVSKVLEGAGNNSDQGSGTKTLEIPIKDGYQAVAGNVVCTFTFWHDDVGIDVVVGQDAHRFEKSSGWSWGFGMNNQVDSIGATTKLFHAETFTVEIEVFCQRTQRALDAWKLKTHASILQAYQKQLRDYEERLAALEVQAAQQIQGRNPAENDLMIRAELKKGAISVFTDQQYDLFGAIGLSSQGFPEPDLPEAAIEGRYIRFFEQAFEWEQMMYLFYPYFWGRKPNWPQRVLLQDVDPLFEEFIKAGAARIVVSVRPGFENAVAHFLNTGEVWNGADLPPVTSPLYVSIIEEIRERDKAPGTEVAQGDPWDVRLPTTLIRLRDQASLPSWQKNAQGEWVPV